MGTVSSQSMDQPRMSESLSACSCWSRLGARAHWFGFRRCTFSRGGNCGTLCFPELSSTADDSGRLMHACRVASWRGSQNSFISGNNKIVALLIFNSIV